MLPVKNFYGKINGKTIFDFIKDLDYSLSQQDRIAEINKRFSNDNGFFEELFEQTFDEKRGVDTSKIRLCLKMTDGVYSETNIAKYLEILTNYILYAPDGEKINKKTEYNFYTDEELFKKEIRDKSLETIIDDNEQSSNEILDFLVEKGKNHKNCIVQKVYSSDILKSNILKEYNDFSEAIKNEILKMKENGTSVYSQRKLGEILKTVKDDMLLSKDMIFGTIYFKQVLADTTVIDWDEFDWSNRNQVIQLLSFRPRTTGFDSSLNCLVYDMFNLLKMITFTRNEQEIIRLLREDKSEVDIAEILGCTHQNINQTLDRVYKKIYETYTTDYEEWYYTYVEKGIWKRCSKCGELKLATDRYFRSHNRTKDGFQSRCRKCEQESDKIRKS